MKSVATVSGITQLSRTVKKLLLHVQDKKIAFKAGQWVDFFIPGVEVFTGYSICSSPYQLKEQNSLALAVKYSDYPPTTWVHTQCQVGSQVEVRVGGEFYFDPHPSDKPSQLLLIAGGVGINPLLSITLHMADLRQQTTNTGIGYTPGNINLLYSARSKEELIFKDKLDSIAADFRNLHCKFFVTKEPSPHSFQGGISCRRIGKEDLACTLDRLRKPDSSAIICFICGPSSMIEDMESNLQDLGLDKSQIRYEKWW